MPIPTDNECHDDAHTATTEEPTPAPGRTGSGRAAVPPGKRQRRMARPPGVADHLPEPATPGGDTGLARRRPRPHGKLDTLAELLLRKEGASLSDMMAATGWQALGTRRHGRRAQGAGAGHCL